MAQKKKKAPQSNTISRNKKARHDYTIETHYEAGLVLEGWEVKSLRAGRVQINDSYVFIRNGEAFLTAAHISPLLSASTHISPSQTRARKLLLNRHELNQLVGAVERKGYTVVPLAMYWKNGRAKLDIALAKGKEKHDKRAAEKDKDWQRDKQRILRGK